jgi:hypothetical protein
MPFEVIIDLANPCLLLARGNEEQGMKAPQCDNALRWTRIVLVCLAMQTLLLCTSAPAINITISYQYDTQNFFNTQPKKDALQAAASRYSAIIAETLTAESLLDNNVDGRIGFTHPGTGLQHEVSSAVSVVSDFVVTNAGASPATEYRGPWSIGANEWILYAGGRSLTSAAEGGTGTGTNLTTVFSDGGSHINRGFRSTGTVQNLPVWGGVISFDNDGGTNWHFNPDTTPAGGTIDFYSIALHEIGHALGLSSASTDWDSLKSGSNFMGPQTVAAYNADNGTSVSSLNQVSSTNRHWQDGSYDSRIFSNANPKLQSTVGLAGMQDLLMEPTANFTASIKRFELTNVDVAALRDLGWSTVPQLAAPDGDYNNNGRVDAADYVAWRKGIADGDYALWRSNFGELTSGSGGGVPEPASVALVVIAAGMISTLHHRRRFRGQ